MLPSKWLTLNLKKTRSITRRIWKESGNGGREETESPLNRELNGTLKRPEHYNITPRSIQSIPFVADNPPHIYFRLTGIFTPRHLLGSRGAAAILISASPANSSRNSLFALGTRARNLETVKSTGGTELLWELLWNSSERSLLHWRSLWLCKSDTKNREVEGCEREIQREEKRRNFHGRW